MSLRQRPFNPQGDDKHGLTVVVDVVVVVVVVVVVESVVVIRV
jgi:hypothetical protein